MGSFSIALDADAKKRVYYSHEAALRGNPALASTRELNVARLRRLVSSQALVAQPLQAFHDLELSHGLILRLSCTAYVHDATCVLGCMIRTLPSMPI